MHSQIIIISTHVQQQQTNMKFSRQQVQDYFNMKTGRAVDRIFCENNVKSIYDFYANLQDYKKNNTLSLRNTLQQNYEKMLYCSDMMDKVKNYAVEVKNVANQITLQLDEEKNNKKGDNEEGHEVSNIENRIRCAQFAYSLRKVKELMENGSVLKTTDRYYLKYLKLEIVTKMQKHVSANMMTKKFVTEYASCLHQFLFITAVDDKQFCFDPSLSRLCKDHKMPSILGIIDKKVKKIEKQQGKEDGDKIRLSLNQCKKLCLEIVFEYKLYLLSKQCKGTVSSQPFEQYFKDLVILVSQSIEDANFHQIFMDSIPNIKKQLATIFISRNEEGQIIFNCDLYDHLTKSQSFSAVLSQFHNKMTESGAQIDNPITFIQQLWHDYFINLIDYSFDVLNPIPISEKLTMYSLPIQKVPPELRSYLYDKSIQNSISSATQYQNKLALFCRNIVPTIERCTEEEKQKMVDKFTQKIQSIIAKVADKLEQLIEGEVKQVNLRKFILLSALLGSLFVKYDEIRQKHSLWKQPISIDKFLSGRYEFNKFYKPFLNKELKFSKKFHYSFVNLDGFFVGYIQGTTDTKITELFKNIIQIICLQILGSLRQQYQGREKDLITHTSESIKKGKQQITVMDYILIPYVAEYVCNCHINDVKIDENVYRKYFSSNKKVEYGVMMEQKMQEEGEDDFEIGDKDDSEEYVKIGKSFLSAGTNFISGFMPKKK